MPRPTKTFLIEAGSSQFRVDLSRNANGYSVAGVFRNETPAGEAEVGLEAFDSFDQMDGPLDTEWIGLLLKQRPSPAAEITVLSDRFTTVVTEMPVGPGEDWRGGVEMEAQTISGLASSEALTSSTRLPAEAGMVCCWVTQVAMRDVALLRTAVAGVKGCRLISVGHPAGVHLDSAVPQLEHWTEFALFHAGGADRMELRGWNGPDALTEARDDGEVASSLIEAGETANLVLGVSDSSPEATDLATPIDLSEAAGVDTWSAALARACDPLTGQILGLPLIAVPKPPPSPADLTMKAILIAAVTVFLLGGHYFFDHLTKTNLEADLAALKEPADRVADARNRANNLRQELKKLTEAEGQSGESEVNVYAHRRRIGALLEGIAVGSEVNGVVVLKFRPDSLDTVLTGAATTFNAPQALASRIDEELAANGWRASLVRRTAKLLRPDGGPWSYEIRLNPGREVSVDEPFEATDEDVSAEEEGATSVKGKETAAINF